MVRIRRFGIVRTATTVAALYAVIALVFVILFGLIALAGVAVVPDSSRTAIGAGVAGLLVFAVIVVLFYAVIGWIFTAIACALYNFVAGFAGGIEIQVESTTPGAPGGGFSAYGYPAYGAPAAYPGQYPAPGQPGGPPAPWAGGQVPPPPAR